MTRENCGGAIAGAVRHANCAPAPTSAENGTRNFTDAASHSQYRTAARFCRSASVKSHTAATQTGGLPEVIGDGDEIGRDHCDSLLSRILPESLLGLLHVLEGEAARFDKVSHHQIGAAAEECQQLVDQAALGIFAGDGGLENVGVADSLDTTQGLLPFQAIDSGLHGGVSRPARLGKCLLNFPNGARAFLPERLQDLQFESGQFREGASQSNCVEIDSTMMIVRLQVFFGRVSRSYKGRTPRG